MNNKKVYIEGRVVGSFAGTLGSKGKKIHLISGDIVDVDDPFIIESIEPEKVRIPQFVSDWIEYFKKYSGSLYGSIAPYSYYGHAITDDFVGDVKKTLEWIRNNSETYARAWLDGYEVEEEKRYYIRLKIDDENYNYLNYIKHLSAWCLAGIKKDKKIRTEHTRKQLEDAGFGEVFNSTLFEVEEVTE